MADYLDPEPVEPGAVLTEHHLYHVVSGFKIEEQRISPVVEADDVGSVTRVPGHVPASHHSTVNLHPEAVVGASIGPHTTHQPVPAGLADFQTESGHHLESDQPHVLGLVAALTAVTAPWAFLLAQPDSV